MTDMMMQNGCGKNKYEELKIHIKSLDENNIINEWFPAHEYLILMEEQLKEQDKQLQEYKEFFSMSVLKNGHSNTKKDINNLLPPSILFLEQHYTKLSKLT